MKSEKIREGNRKIFALLADYINNYPDAITPEMISETMETCGVGKEDAFRILISGIFDVYGDKEFRNGWIYKMFSYLCADVYENDPYRKAIKLPAVRDGEWEFFCDSYKPYELFVFNDPLEDSEGRVFPQVGYFDREYTFPAVRQAGREWMLITPNEIETMKAPVAAAFGEVVTYGLGLGYFAFMASEKNDVTGVTVVEKDESVIRLFEKHILPQFPNKDKIRIICADAFEYAEKKHPCDFVFADIWHDPSDGCGAYLKFKALECEGTQYAYWIENTLKYYL